MLILWRVLPQALHTWFARQFRWMKVEFKVWVTFKHLNSNFLWCCCMTGNTRAPPTAAGQYCTCSFCPTQQREHKLPSAATYSLSWAGRWWRGLLCSWSCRETELDEIHIPHNTSLCVSLCAVHEECQARQWLSASKGMACAHTHPPCL